MNQIKGKVIALLLAASVLVESVAGMMLDTRNVQAAEPENVGYYYAAKGQPKVFQLSKKGTVKVTKDAGNKYTVSGNKVTFICTKEGTIELGNGKKQVSFVLYIGGNEKDTKVNKKEYDMSGADYGGKTYHNFVDAMRVFKKKEKGSYAEVTYFGKKEVNKNKKYDRNVVYGTDLVKVEKKYPSWQDIGGYGDDCCCWTSLYYDKKSGYVFEKGFVLNSKYKVKGVVYIGYNPKHKNYIVKL